MTVGFSNVIYMAKDNKFKEFTIIKADYLITDNTGGGVILRVEYAKNRYSLLKKGRKGLPLYLTDAAGKMAEDMLKRKSKVNFIGKLLQYI